MKGCNLLARALVFRFGTYYNIVEGATCCKRLGTLSPHVEHLTIHCNRVAKYVQLMLRHVALKYCDYSARAYIVTVIYVLIYCPHKIFSHLIYFIYVIILARKANEYSYAGK